MIATPVIEAKVKIPTNGKDYVPDFILPPHPIFPLNQGIKA